MNNPPLFTAGFRDRIFGNDPFLMAVWYPATQAETDVRHMGVVSKAARNAPIAPDQKFPLVLISHGSEGHRFNLFWLAEFLARQGFIVAAIQHAGDNYLEKERSRSLDILQSRPSDISAALDLLLQYREIGPSIHRSKIYGLGHSVGGATVLKLAGWKFDVSAWKHYCETLEGKGDIICEFAPKDEQLEKLDDWAGEPVLLATDDRISAFVAITPAFGIGATSKAFERFNKPLLIIEADHDEVLSYETNAKKFREILQGKARFVKVKGSGHYSFLPECTPYIARNYAYLCRDFGRERAEIHGTTQKIVLHFLKEVSGASD